MKNACFTPEEAQALWCPMVRAARRERERPEGSMSQGETYIASGCNTDALGGNRVPVFCRCIADRCAMWRWAHTTESVRTEHEVCNGSTAVLYTPKVVRTHGYCGLAGRPEF